jgi:two-component system, NtrC family, sensor histidine kinase HydH
LITESSRENDIVFIRIMNRNGSIKNQTDGAPKVSLSNREVGRLMDSDASLTHIEGDKGIIVISRSFHLHNSMADLSMMGRRMGMMRGNVVSDGVISVGLYTKEFDLARKQDIRHAFFMGAILLLVGSAGLYFLFLYQGIRVANTTLANMKLSIPAMCREYSGGAHNP